MTETKQDGSRRGVIYGATAYGMWGLIALYFKAVAHVAPLEVLAHRALWSFVVLTAVVLAVGRWNEVWTALRDRKILPMLALSSLLVALNWLTFIYAVESRQLLQSSLGQFINPLVNVLLGVVFLGERLRKYQVLSILMATMGVLMLAVLVGQVPWIAITLATTFGFYALVRKLVPVDGTISLALETLLMTPVALAYLGYLAGERQLTGAAPGTFAVLMLAGPVTSVPLLLFGAAARRLRLATMGILHFIIPTMQFTVAVVLFKEPFQTVQLASFVCIWTAVVIYVADSYRAMREVKEVEEVV